MDSLRQDVKFAVRSLLKRPSFAVMVVATLALGIGANTAIFSLLHALVLRSLPVADPARLVVISRRNLSQPYPLFRHFQEHSTTLEGVVAFFTSSWRMTTGQGTERIKGTLVSGSYFRVLGVQPALGALITEDDDEIVGEGGSRGAVAVLSYGFWMRRFGGQPSVVGSRIVMNERPFTIVGVAPPGFEGTEVGASPDVFAPLTLTPTLAPGLGSSLGMPRSQWVRIIGRLKPDTDLRRAEGELTTLLQAYTQELLRDPEVEKFGAEWRRTRLAETITLLPGGAGISPLRQRYSQPLFVVMAVMGLVLLIACANIANLTLNRAASRRQEFAIRLGLGASRRRIVGQLLIESVMLAGVGAAAGLLLARVGRDVLLTYLPLEQSLSAPLDRTVLLFTLALSVGAALLFGLWPAFQSANVDVAPALRDGGTGGAGGTGATLRAPLRKGLIVFQIGVSLVVVIGAVLFLRSLHALLAVDTGFTRQNILIASVDISPERVIEKYGRVLDEVRRLPGVLAAGAADSGPLGTRTGWTIYVEGYQPKAVEPRSSPWVGFISPDYFKTMEVPLLSGRDFDERDVRQRAGGAGGTGGTEGKGANVIIVNETFARHYFGNENPIGRRVGLDRGIFDIEIVGVVKDSKYTGLKEEPIRMVYVPQRPGPWGAQFTLHVRTAGEPMAIAGALRKTIASIDPAAPVYDIRTAEQAIGRTLLRERLLSTITLLFGGLALLLATLGLYGVMSYGVTRRWREFGIRMEVGAASRGIVALVMRDAVWVLLIGLAVGLGTAWMAGRIIRSQLYGIEPTDVVSVVIAVCILASAALLAAWLPARRASRIDPIRALRYE